MSLLERLLKYAVCSVLGIGMSVSQQAYSQPGLVSIEAARIESGETASWLQCPCFRWVVQTQLGGGRLETQQFLISSEALFSFRDETMMDFRRYASRTTRIGAVEALWKGGHVGVGFKGLGWGKDRDRGYSDLLEYGLYGLVNLVRTESLRLDIRSGYDFESMRINLGRELDNAHLDQAANLRWRPTRSRWSGEATVHVGLTPSSSPLETLDYGAAGGIRLRILDLHGLQLGVNGELALEHDGFRESLGLDPDLIAESVTMSLSYVAGAR